MTLRQTRREPTDVRGHAQPAGRGIAALPPPGERRTRIFRHVNERIRELAGTFAFGEPLELFCECAYASCDARFTIEPGDYEEVRALGTRYLVAPGHEQPELEIVVEQRAGYAVVEER